MLTKWELPSFSINNSSIWLFFFSFDKWIGYTCFFFIFKHIIVQTHPPAPFFKGGGAWLNLPKIPRKGEWKNCWMVDGILRRGGFCRKEGVAVSLGSWGVVNATTVPFNYILVIVFLFSLNVGVSPCFHCTFLVPVYTMYTSCCHNTVVSSRYRLRTFCLYHRGVTSCFGLNMWF